MRKLSILLALALLGLVHPARATLELERPRVVIQSLDPYNPRGSERGFRDFSWGTAESVIKASEKAEFSKRLKGLVVRLVYETKLQGEPCLLVYQFVDNKLAGGYLVFEGEALAEEFVAVFEALRKRVSELYGPPSDDEITWKQQTGRQDTVDMPFEKGLWFGYASRRAEWKLTPTTMTLTVQSVEGAANVKVFFYIESQLLKPLLTHAEELYQPREYRE